MDRTDIKKALPEYLGSIPGLGKLILYKFIFKDGLGAKNMLLRNCDSR